VHPPSGLSLYGGPGGTIPCFLVKVIAVTLEQIEVYVLQGGLHKNDIEKKKLLIEQKSAVQSKIAMIKNIVLRQEEVWKTFSKQMSRKVWERTPNNTTLANVKDLTLRPKDDFRKLKHRIQRIEQGSERAEAVILVQLDLKSKHASLRESHNSLLLSMAVIGFTIITIIFAPLSFLTSLLALPIDQFPN
jgi:Mg2+ and Co2+ transporter CorA